MPVGGCAVDAKTLGSFFHRHGGEISKLDHLGRCWVFSGKL
jgi:hypothetical protein